MASSSFQVRHSLEPRHLHDLVAIYRETWWAADRQFADIEQMLDASDAVVAVIDVSADRVVGFARALTDRTYFAIVLDVVVVSALQAQGLGRLIMDAVVSHPALHKVRSIELVCQQELIDFYRQWGFDDQVGGSTLMRRVDPT